jgi:cobalt-zinc-cadmium efflux system outer membrane protein
MTSKGAGHNEPLRIGAEGEERRRHAHSLRGGAPIVGCATYRPEVIAPAASVAVLEARTLDDPRLTTFIDAVSPGPTRRAPTWSLETLTLAAVYFHPDLALADAKLAAAAEAAIRTARQRPNPTLTVGPEYMPNAVTPLSVAGAVSLIVETFGKRRDRTDEAAELADAAREDIGAVAWQVCGRVRASLIDLWVAQRRQGIDDLRLDQEDQLVTLLEHRLDVGDADNLDLSRERINREPSLPPDWSFADLRRRALTGRADVNAASPVMAWMRA